jgi:tRNA threonylcarbamoyladenosine biosynthesis protein TsaB
MILAIETATHSIGVAIVDGSGVLASTEVLRGRRHAETVVPAIRNLLVHLQCALREIDEIAVDIGPGLFTGLRVGVATAKALALANELAIVGVSSLEVVAAMAAERCFPCGLEAGPCWGEGSLIGAVLDARRKELYGQLFEVAAGVPGTVRAIGEPVVGPAEAVGAALDATSARCETSSSWWCAGEGFAAYPELVQGRSAVAISPSAAMLGRLALDPARTRLGADDVELLYLRPPDAEINWKTR